MITLSNLKNPSRPYKRVKRLGRGIGSKHGKTSCRGEKGAGARSGSKRRWGYEGGQFRTFMKIPERGFSNERFRRPYDVINLKQIEASFNDGEVVNAQTLADKGFLSGVTYGIKVLGNGTMSKKVKLEVAALSATAQEKLQKANIEITII
jgi:large subunit ribosomal protein L15